jgi:hypothetical protein
MSRCSQHHLELNAEGIGKCSVPMWCGGTPADFCDADAYGPPPPSRTYYSYGAGTTVREDGRYNGYVPGLACPGHGGPKSRVMKDGNAYCATFPDFVNLQESPNGWGDTPEAARLALTRETRMEAT